MVSGKTQLNNGLLLEVVLRYACIARYRIMGTLYTQDRNKRLKNFEYV